MQPQGPLSGDPTPPPTTASVLLQMLKAEGVSRVFGIPGGALVGMLEAIRADPTVTYHTCRQETGAAYIADGYARVSGGLGVVLVTSGPGATNAVTGAVNADASGTPLLVISGEIKEAFFGRGYLQEGIDADLDVVDLYGSAIDYSEMITSPQNAQELVQSALRHAFGPPGRAAHLSLPGDVAMTPPTPPVTPTAPPTYRVTNGFVDVAGVTAAVDAIAAAKRPLLMIGDGCRRALTDPAALAAFVAAVDHLSVPVITDPDAKGLFPETHALSLRNFGIAGCAWPPQYLAGQPGAPYDALVVIGSPLGELATNTWEGPFVPQGPFIQVDNDPRAIGRAFQITRGVVGEIGAALAAFSAAAKQATVDPAVAAERRAFVAQIKATSPFKDPEKRTAGTTPIKPQELARIVSTGLEPGAHIFVDAGNCVGWSLHDMVVDPPTQIHTALAMGPMGFATGAVVGARLAAPSVPCVAVVGDGGFMMQLGEVATAAQYGIGAIWVVLADHDLAMVSQGMATITKDPTYDHYYKLGWTDLAAAARGLGATAYEVSSPDDAAAALLQALAGADTGVPQVIVAAIDTSEMPPYDYAPPPPAPPLP